MPSKAQLVVWSRWEEFWDEWVPRVTHGEPFTVVFNGDAIDGVHHGAVTQFTHNLADQVELAHRILKPIVDACGGNYYHIRGTEAHGGQSGQEEERLARMLGAIPGDTGQHARWELWLRLAERALIHFTHHIGTAGSLAYETTAIQKEMEQAFVESGRWEEAYPDVIVRSHRHRNAETRIQGSRGFVTAFTTAGWQLKTPLAHRIAGARQTQPQIGGTMIRVGDEDVYTRHILWKLDRPPEEVA